MPQRRAVSVLATLALSASLATVTGPPASADPVALGTAGRTAESDRPDRGGRTATADRPWSGFRIERTDDAAGAWIGARKVGRGPGRVVYRIDPLAVPRTRSFGATYRVARLLGPGAKLPAGRDAVRRAAWIVSKYGSFRYEIQSAAVDAALLHLLTRRRFALDGPRARARLRQTGYAPQVARFARIMLRDSRRLAGPYRVVATQVGHTPVGQQVRLSVRVLSVVTRAPLRSVPVSVRVGSGAWRSAGETGDDGVASFAYRGRTAGRHQVTVRVHRVPQDRLLVLPARPRSASRAVVAGRKLVRGLARPVFVQARPVLRLDTAWIRAGARTRGTLGVRAAYGAEPRRAVLTLHGPFAAADQASCGRSLLFTRRTTVPGNGRYTLPSFTLRRPGAYIWQVSLRGNRHNVAASACGGRFGVRAP